METCRIPLTQGKFALVDAADYDRVSQFKWCATCTRRKWYARRIARVDGRWVTVRMHRFVLDVPPGVEVDHENGDGLDNRRGNLRYATDVQNAANSRRGSNNRSGFKGVWRQAGGWLAKCGPDYLGVYDTADLAARAYDTHARARYGAFANLNFPDGLVEVAPRRGGPARVNTSGYRGVSYRKAEGKWTARLTRGGQRLHLGYFDSAEHAAAALAAKVAALR